MTKLTKRLLRLKETNDWSYDELAGYLGTTKSQAHDWAMGKYEPHVKTLQRLARKLKCDLMDLVDAA